MRRGGRVRERQGKNLTWIFVRGPGDPSNATGCPDWLHFQRVTSAAKQRVKFAADRASGSGRRDRDERASARGKRPMRNVIDWRGGGGGGTVHRGCCGCGCCCWRSDNAPGGGGAHGAFDQRSARARVAPTSPLPLLPIPNCTGVRLLYIVGQAYTHTHTRLPRPVGRK